METMNREPLDARSAVEQVAAATARVRAEIARRIVGQQDVVESLLTAMLCQGHCLFIGVPGLAKTLLISTLAQTLDLTFKRIQFTPDLMPSDITGTEILEDEHATGKRHFKFVKGPVFSQVLLADEINRTPPKTQAALLQAMQEYRVTAGGVSYDLDRPFFVFATQNPIEQEGTYPLPEAQLDRFMFSVRVQYPSMAEEVQIVKNTTSTAEADARRVLSGTELRQIQQWVREVPVAEHVVQYAVRLVRASRPGADAPDVIRDCVTWGAGPRASQYLILGAKARAIMAGRFAASAEDVRALAPVVLGHRILPNFHAEARNLDALALVARLLELVPEDA